MYKKNTTINRDNETPSTSLNRLGWSSHFQQHLPQEMHDLSPARVVGVRKKYSLVHTGSEELLVSCSGTILRDPSLPLPAVGDWVLLRDVHITAVLPRINCLERKVPGGRDRKNGASSHDKQVLAANLDTVFIVCGLDRDFNLRRIERYLTMIYNCGITPAIILTKADLHEDPAACLSEVEATAFGAQVFVVSRYDDEAIAGLAAHLTPGQTFAMIGSSGAGKSTLINGLYGSDIRETSAVSAALGKGRHTTTTRDLVILPSGAMVIDNPGIREIALSADSEGAGSAFPDIEALAVACRFSDCSHTNEPGCSVQEAIVSGELDGGRLKSYVKIRAELDYTRLREQKSPARVERERWKGVAQKIKAIKKRR